MDPELTVLVVTCGRPERLLRVLQDLGRQSLDPRRFELLIADDGSPEPAEQTLSRIDLGFPVRVARGPCRGPATARNRALPLARAPLLLFLNDDVWLEPELLEAHLLLQRYVAPAPWAVMGTLAFPPELRREMLHRLVEDLGLLGTARLETGSSLDPMHFWTGNLSVPTAEVRAVGGFDEAFREPAGEDIDLGYRLARERGVRLMYTQHARAWHDHPHDPAAWWERCRRYGRVLRHLAEKHVDELFRIQGTGFLDPALDRKSLERLAEQEPLALELMSWVDRLGTGPAPVAEVVIPGIETVFHLPQDAELLMRVGLYSGTYYVVHRAYREPRPEGWRTPDREA